MEMIYDHWKCIDTEADLQAELDYKDSILEAQLLEELEELSEEELEDLKRQVKIDIALEVAYDDFLYRNDEYHWENW
jgi:hypothetical protein